MNKIKELYYRTKFEICDYLLENSKVYISLNFYKLIREYIKCFMVFKCPKFCFYKLKPDEDLGSDYFFLENSTVDWIANKWLYIACSSLGYKSKWDDLVFEQVPYIVLIWRNKVKYVIGLESPVYEECCDYIKDKGNILHYRRDNSMYWETIIDYLYISKRNAIKAFNNNIYSKSVYFPKNDPDRKWVSVPVTSFNMFRKKYREQIKKAANKQYYDLKYLES